MGFFELLFGNSKTKSKKGVSAKADAEKPIAEEKVDTASEPSEEKVEVKSPVEEKTEATEVVKETAPKITKAKTTKTVTKKEPATKATEEVPESSAEPITGRFEINRSKDGKKYFFNLYASNKVGIATSQMYSSAQSALIGVKSVIANAASAPIEDQSLKKYDELPFPKWIIYVDKGGKYRFHLCATNGSNVCHSQGYTTKAACKNGIESIIRSSRNAEIDKSYLTNKQ